MAKWIVQNGPLYKQEGISYNPSGLLICKKPLQSEEQHSKGQPENQAELETGPTEAAQITNKYLCQINNCDTPISTTQQLDRHLLLIHNAHLPGEHKPTTSSSVESVLLQNKNLELADNEYTCCPICETIVQTDETSKLHMFQTHNLLDLSTALSYHRNAKGLQQLTAFTAHPADIITMKDKHGEIPQHYKTTIITLKQTQLYNHKETTAAEFPTLEGNNRTMQEDRRASSLNKKLDRYTTKQKNTSDTESDSSDWEIDKEPTGATDTLLTGHDFVEPKEFIGIHNVAPGEHQTPKSIFLDKYCEELAYPDIFLGHARPSERLVTIHYSDIVKSELQRADRRAATNVENLFFKTKKLQMKLITSRTQIALRQHKTKDMTITAGTLKNQSAITQIIQHDQGYKFLSNVRGSPPFFEAAKKDLFAMIRQLGPATFFMSLSAAETKWNHLLKTLGKTVDNRNYTEEDISTLEWEDKCRLIQSDPTTCARHFEFQLQNFITHYLKSKTNPIGKLLDYSYRVEMQHRGSCHVHMVVWIEGAAKVTENTDAEIATYIDQHVTCKQPNKADQNACDLVKRQKHRHSFTCKKNKAADCRFHFPQPPMEESQLLEPLEKEDENYDTYKEHWKTITKDLNKMAKGTELTLTDYLQSKNITYECYVKSIQTSITKKTIFLKRTTQEMLINNYNQNILKAWRANMDIQFILDAYACATYIVSYITKSSRGMSKLLARATKEARSGNTDIKEAMRHISNQFLNSVEISAQEATYLALGLPLKKSSRSTIFINTSPPQDRVRLLKPQTDIDEMDDTSTNIDASNILKRYSMRHTALENKCLAEYATWYDVPKQTTKDQKDREDTDGTPIQNIDPLYQDNTEDIPEEDLEPANKPKKRRRKARILRCPWFNVHKEEELHYRELLMLFLPWRNEATDIISTYPNYKERYLANIDTIKEQLKEYSPGGEAVEAAIALQAQEINNDNHPVAPNAEHRNRNDEEKETQINDPHFEQEYDIAADMGIHAPTPIAYEELAHNEMEETEFRATIRMLNQEQKTIFNYITENIRNDKGQMTIFLSGGGGVGKSLASRAIYQQLLKIYNAPAGTDSDKLKVLVMAPTGKAAHIIKGLTIHAGLKLPFNNLGSNYIPLTASNLNTARSKLGSVKFVMIDEISMVGNNVFNYVDRRLQDIKGSTKPFGGCHMLCIGDLYQLQPVCDSWIFIMPKNNLRAFAPNMWKNHFELYELTKIMRQKDHQPFAELLNRLREGKQTPTDTAYLRTKQLRQDFTTQNYQHKSVTHLFGKNETVNDFNKNVRTNEPIMITAKHHVGGSCNETLQGIHLNKMKDKKAKEAQGLEPVLTLALNDRIETSLNINISDGLTNGASGQIMQLPTCPNNTNTMEAAGYIWVHFDEEDIGKQTRKKHKRLYQRNTPKDWTPISTQQKHLQVSRRTDISATRTQFPIRNSAAKTIHRCQGQTLNAVVADFASTHSRHMHYVALSRVTNPDNLYITNFDANPIRTDKDVKAEMARLRSTKKLNIPHQINYKEMKPNSAACFMNIRSLNKYAKDLANDYNFKNSYITIIAETHIQKRTAMEELLITHPHTNHNCSAYNKTTQPAKHGISIFATKPITNVTCKNTSNLESISATTSDPIQCTFIGIYRYHQSTRKDFFEDMRTIISPNQHNNLIIMGDMNLNTQEHQTATQIEHELLNPFRLRQLQTAPTTKAGTTIDHVYTNMTTATASTIPTYYSDHDLIAVFNNQNQGPRTDHQ